MSLGDDERSINESGPGIPSLVESRDELLPERAIVRPNSTELEDRDTTSSSKPSASLASELRLFMTSHLRPLISFSLLLASFSRASIFCSKTLFSVACFSVIFST